MISPFISFRGIFRNFLFLLLLKDPAKKLLPGCWPVTKSLGWGSFSNHGEMRSNADDPIMMEREFPHTPPSLCRLCRGLFLMAEPGTPLSPVVVCFEDVMIVANTYCMYLGT